jgi:hypothetical protein
MWKVGAEARHAYIFSRMQLILRLASHVGLEIWRPRVCFSPSTRGFPEDFATFARRASNGTLNANGRDQRPLSLLLIMPAQSSLAVTKERIMASVLDATSQNSAADNFTPDAIQDFAERLLGVFNDAALTLMMSIGHRTRLFDVMAQMDPATSQEIADEAGLNERYVREWLGAMPTGGIVDHNPASHRYWLPAERAACLTRAASPNNLASVAQWFAVLGAVED